MLSKERCRFVSSLQPVCHIISKAGSLGSQPRCDKSEEHWLLGKLSTLQNCFVEHICWTEKRKREREFSKNIEGDGDSKKLGGLKEEEEDEEEGKYL